MLIWYKLRITSFAPKNYPELKSSCVKNINNVVGFHKDGSVIRRYNIYFDSIGFLGLLIRSKENTKPSCWR